MKVTFSVVITVHDQSEQIRENLPGVLEQQYEGGFEVVVVDQFSADETIDILKQQKDSHANLYTTFIPKYHFQKDRRRLALTIGVKASKNQWIILADIDKIPTTPTWLEELSEFCATPTRLLAGYINRQSGDITLKTYTEISEARKLISRTERRHGERRRLWTRWLRRDYDFLVVRADEAHHLLQLYETNKYHKL